MCTDTKRCSECTLSTQASANVAFATAQVFFCFTQSVASTRWAIQDQQRIMNTPCDNCLIGTMIFCQYLACLCDIAACLSGSQEIAELAHLIDITAQAIWCS